MRRGLVLAALAAAALMGLPAAASADTGDPVVYFSFDDGVVFPQGYNVQLGFLCASDTSTIVSCVGSQPLGSLLDTAQAGPHTVTVTATDFEGRQTVASRTYTVLDITKPHVVFRTPADGATYGQGSNLTYDYGCEDDPGGLGILACVSNVPLGAPIDTSQLGTFSFSVTAVDQQLNISQETIHYSIVDRTPPRITLTVPADGATYTVGQQVFAFYSCDDGNGSGMNGCKGDLGSGSPLDTSSPGTGTFSVTAYDRAGNVAHETHTYSVVYDFSGFASPAADYPAATAMKAGENIPLKFSLHGDQGSNIFAGRSPAWLPCGALDGQSPADGTLSYNASADRYTFLAATSKAWAGTCRDLIVTLRDGTTHRARFTFGK
jgi:hypothetical protein